MPPSKRISVGVSIFISILLIADGSLVLYACLLWPRDKVSSGDPLFVVGVATFMACFTLPFFLIIGFMVCFFCCDGSQCCCWQKPRRKPSTEPKTDAQQPSNPDRSKSKKDRSASSSSGIRSLHRLDLLPPSFISAHFGPLVKVSNQDGKEDVVVVDGNKSVELRETHFKRSFKDRRRWMQQHKRASVMSSASAAPLPKVNFIKDDDGEEVMAVETEGTCSKVTTDV